MAVDLTKVRDFDRFMLRLPPGMRDKIAAAAEKAGRSMNTELIARLEASFERDDEAIEVRAYVDEHEKRIGKLESDVERLLDRAGMLPDRWDD